MTGTGRIRWSEDTGLRLWCGSVGTIGSMFTIAIALIEGDPHLLMSSFPGQERKRRDSVDLNELKTEAERWLEEFISSLGAVFGTALAAGLRSHASEIEATPGLPGDQRGPRAEPQVFAAGIRRAADLAEHGDRPAVNATPDEPPKETGQ